MYPLTFTEFLNTKDPAMYQYMCSVKEIAPLPQIFFDKLREAFIAYSICGGMPEPASLMVDTSWSCQQSRSEQVTQTATESLR